MSEAVKCISQQKLKLLQERKTDRIDIKMFF